MPQNEQLKDVPTDLVIISQSHDLRISGDAKKQNNKQKRLCDSLLF